MENAKTASGSGVNRAKTYQLVLFPLNNGPRMSIMCLSCPILQHLETMYWGSQRYLPPLWLPVCVCLMRLRTR